MQAMGRIFEVRKHTMFARWKPHGEAVRPYREGHHHGSQGRRTDPASNPVLRRTIQNARAVNMPKDRIEAAIKRAAGRDAANYQQVLYEGYAPHGVALLVETATTTDAHRRGGAQHHHKGGGNLATNGSVSFLFRKMGVFRLDPRESTRTISSCTSSTTDSRRWREQRREGRAAAGDPLCLRRFRPAAGGAGARGLAPLSAEHEYLCTVPTELPESQATEVLTVIDRLEQDDDVQNVFHTLA